ncbi:MAG: hypothetical protein IPK98_16845 [Chloracidobacterium sp.]|nr:hypothetical protein [Chloracidobacterium sp.]
MKGYDDLTDGDWVVLPRGDVAPHWSGLYVTLNRGGSIVLSRVTHERLGEPTGYLIMFDRFTRRLALKPAVPAHVTPIRQETTANADPRSSAHIVW